MLFRTLYITVFFFIFTTYSYSAATSGGGTKSNYDQAAKLIKDAKKYESKGKDTDIKSVENNLDALNINKLNTNYGKHVKKNYCSFGAD